MSDALPDFKARKIIEMISPFCPVKPGVGRPPVNVTVPAELENAGFWAHSENIDELWSIDITWSRFGGNWIVATAVLMSAPSVFTRTWTETILPACTAVATGLNVSVAACAEGAEAAKNNSHAAINGMTRAAGLLFFLRIL